MPAFLPVSTLLLLLLLLPLASSSSSSPPSEPQSCIDEAERLCGDCNQLKWEGIKCWVECTQQHAAELKRANCTIPVPFQAATAMAQAGPATTTAYNPLVPHVGMADPHVHVFNGRLYMYSTHDLIEEGATGCCSGDWWVWTAPYPSGPWTNVSSLADPPWTPAGLLHENWATDAAERGGAYYWYVSIGGSQVAVFNASTPAGPWQDPLGTFLLSDGHRLDPPTSIRDPGVLRDEASHDDDDKDKVKYYLVFGACGGPVQPDDSCYYLAELNEDMISHQEPRHLSVRGALGPYGHGKADDKVRPKRNAARRPA